MSNTVRRFSAKAAIYDACRWDYAPEAIDAIFHIAGLSGEGIVVDVGAGTGMLSRHMVDRGWQVVAVEPNPVMRARAEEALGERPNFTCLAGLAHATSLPARSVDLIAVGRALHWFEPEKTRAEFLRILKPAGWLAVLQVPCTDEPLLEAVQAIRTRENGWDVGRDKSSRRKVPLRFYFGGDDFSTRRYPGTVEESWPAFLGRLTSLSAAPDAGHPLYPAYKRAARDIFERFSRDGLLTVRMATEMTLGRVQ